jgi:hypothetical protein
MDLPFLVLLTDPNDLPVALDVRHMVFVACQTRWTDKGVDGNAGSEIRLDTGDMVMVKETVDEVVNKMTKCVSEATADLLE